MTLEKRIFSYFVLMLFFVFLTGCSTTKWEWLPKNKASYEIKSGDWEEEPQAIDVIRISF
mgnify:CR=1 FL=1|jgi:hypothetical protein|tara:strand:- start:80 stop:259 length:180 start_codon:yes stop_codon:yes gene_type:complete